MTNSSFSSTTLNNNIYKWDQKKIEVTKSDELTLSFDRLVLKFPSIPENTAVLGNNGSMPILFDLEDPRPGSIQIVNEHLPSIRKLMTVMMKSLTHYSSPSNFQFITISHYPEKWIDNIQNFDPQFTYCAGVSGDYENSTEDWILFLAKKAEDRINGRNHGPAVILFIDDIGLIDQLELRIRLTFDWLIKYGSLAKIWVVSGLDLNLNSDPKKPLDKFKTRIYGRIVSGISKELKDSIPMGIVKDLNPERHYTTKIRSNWIQFWAPKLQG